MNFLDRVKKETVVGAPKLRTELLAIASLMSRGTMTMQEKDFCGQHAIEVIDFLDGIIERATELLKRQLKKELLEDLTTDELRSMLEVDERESDTDLLIREVLDSRRLGRRAPRRPGSIT